MKKEKRKENVYLASSMEPCFRDSISKAAEILRKTFDDVYVPMEHTIKNAWDYPNNEWGLMVFTNDITAIDNSEIIVFLNFGRSKTTAGCAWEAGYAFASDKKIIVVDIDNNEDFITSLMIENGRYATVRNLEGLENYDWEKMTKSRTIHEQK